MADPQTSTALHLPGRLVKDPSDLTASFPHGGTVLGQVIRVALFIDPAASREHGEEYGPVEPIEILELGESWELRCWLVDGDDDFLSAVARNTVGGGADPVGPSYPGSRGAGSRGTDRTFSALLVPDASLDANGDARTDANAKAVYLRSAIPDFVRRQFIDFGAGSMAAWQTHLVARRDTTTESGSNQWQRLDKITL